VASLVLLTLFVHAFLASATHFHRFSWNEGVAAGQTETSARGREEATRRADAAGHAQCLTCRLQRNFVAECQKTSRLAEPELRDVPTARKPQPFPVTVQSFSVPAGRAPPLA
jgi:hypothetical protein